MKNLEETSVRFLKGVGPSRFKLFENLGVTTVEDLLFFFPRRYDDRRQMTPISKLRIGEWQTVSGEVILDNSRRAWYTKKHVSEVIIGDDTGKLYGIWFNQPYISQYLKSGEKIVLYGKVEVYKERLQMVAPEYEIIDEEEGESLSIGRIVPVYPLVRGLSQRYLRKIIKSALDEYAGVVRDVLPFSLRQAHKLENLMKSLNNLHYPESFELQKESYRRVAFEEFFLFQVSVNLRKMSVVTRPGISHKVVDGFCEEFADAFSFSLTGAQKKVIGDISRDMKSSSPMHRLLQGDVGCGKTLVAFFGCAVAHANGYQSAFMAPTEILARQHFDVLKGMIENSRFKKMRLALLTSSLKAAEKEKVYRELQSGNIDLAVGTHALLEEGVTFHNLSFIVIDEQHKFGVRQRSLLSTKGTNPDTLIMTATPIPRTLCLTLYGDLDISVIDELPPGRGAIKTLHFSLESAPEAYKMIKERILRGEQAYIVYPIIEESAKLDLKAAKEMFESLKENEFKEFKVGLLHGQMKKNESQIVMNGFKNKDIDILIATTVLEVGVDVPNATVMIIEHADRFGLSQLHQLRGRIGRAGKDSLCVLLANPVTPEAVARLDAVCSTTDGFAIAEKDLMIRGPGEFFGRHQHGLNELKIANPLTQLDILQAARKEAVALTQSDPHFKDSNNKLLRVVIERRYPTYLDMARAG